MKTVIALLVFATSLPAFADPGYDGTSPITRDGRVVIGATMGLGGIADRGGQIECINCDYKPLTLGLAVQVGFMAAHRLAVMLELQANGQIVASDAATNMSATLVQSAVMGAARGWVTPRLWLEGGLGVAHLEFDYNDNFRHPASQTISNGGAMLAAIGYELIATPTVAFDVQGRLLVGTYHGIDDQISSATVGLGINWY